MKKHFSPPFNMVEIALALAVIGIGIAGVMSLFPVGFNSIRDAMAESYGADMAEEFLAQISQECKRDWTTWINTADNNGIIQNPAQTDMSSDWNSVTEGAQLIGDIYYTSKQDVFLIKRKTGNIVDFEAHIQIYKSPITNLNVAGQNVDFSDGSMSAYRYEYGAIIYATISWPASKPYDAREKRVYCKEIFKPM